MTKPCPIVVCKGLGCGWRGPMPNNRQPQCPRCLKYLVYRPGRDRE